MFHHQLPPVIGFAGAMGSGKTTVARHLLHAYPYVPASFADPLKDMLVALGVPRENLCDQHKKSEPCAELGGWTPRWGMQSLGTEWGREMIHEDIWCHALRKRLAPRTKAGQRFVIDDVRFDNEARVVRALGGVVIQINRPRPDPRPWWRRWRRPHASERGLSPFLIDYRIANTGDVSQLLQSVEEALQSPWLPLVT